MLGSLFVTTLGWAQPASEPQALGPDPCAKFVASAPSGMSCQDHRPTGSRPQGQAIGVRIRLLRAGADAAFTSVPLSTSVCNGDRLAFEVESSFDGLVTIMSHGTSGRWRRQYPPPGQVVGKLSAKRPLRVPAREAALYVAGPAGTEYLLLLVSRTPFSAELQQTVARFEGTWMPAEPGGIAADNQRVLLLRGDVGPEQGWVLTEDEHLIVVPIDHAATCP
ncbi:MAG: DUF4384 domain-containing protein [Myxococcota bacterium]